MKGIEVFLVLLENNKDVCYLEYKDIEELIGMDNGIMMVWRENKYGISLNGKVEDKELLTTRLLKDHKKTLNKERKELDKKFDLFKKITVENL